jgi:hypothetical protein
VRVAPSGKTSVSSSFRRARAAELSIMGAER